MNVNTVPDDRARAAPRRQKDGGKNAYLLLALPAVCCGLPVIVTVLAEASALTKGLLVGAGVALVGLVLTILVRRHGPSDATCCELDDDGVPSPQPHPSHQAR